MWVAVTMCPPHVCEEEPRGGCGYFIGGRAWRHCESPVVDGGDHVPFHTVVKQKTEGRNVDGDDQVPVRIVAPDGDGLSHERQLRLKQPRLAQGMMEEQRQQSSGSEVKESNLTRLACLWTQQELCGRRPKRG